METENKETWKEWKGKRVFIKLKEGREYSGIIKGVSPSRYDKEVFILLEDKFGQFVLILNSEIKLMQEEGRK